MAVNGASVDSRLTGTAKANSPIMRNNFRKVQPSKTGALPFLDNYCIECNEDERVRKKLSVEQIGHLKPSDDAEFDWIEITWIDLESIRSCSERPDHAPGA